MFHQWSLIGAKYRLDYGLKNPNNSLNHGLVGSNFDSYHLKDFTSWEKYENSICGVISISSYGLIELLSNPTL